MDESESELLELAIPEIRLLYKSESKIIYTSHEVSFGLPNVQFSVPQRGDKKSLIELSLRNARYHRVERLKNIQKKQGGF